MPEIWIALTGVIILFLFWRQLIVFRMQAKINYAPLVLIIGSISSVSLFVFSSHEGELKHDIQYALMPLLISLIFYMVMYLMYQLKINSARMQQKEHEKLLAVLITNIKEYFSVLDGKLSAIESTDEKTLSAVQMALKNEFSVFTQLSSKQEMILSKLEEMYTQEENALIKIQNFLDKDVMDLDAVVHRHIDVLRIAEKDHFNKLLGVLGKMSEDMVENEIAETVQSLHGRLDNIDENFRTSASLIVSEAKEALSSTVESINTGLQNTKQLSEILMLSTQEYEVKLQELHKQASQLLQKSDTIHESMEDTFVQSQKVRPVYNSLNELVSRLMDIYTEYKHAKKELHILASELGNAEERHFEVMDKKIDDLGVDIHKKIEASLLELKEHYHIADREVTSTVKTLAAKAQMKKSYVEE